MAVIANNIKRRYGIGAFVCLGLLVSTVGCGGTYDASATGVVTLNGAALPCGWVAFHPQAGGPAAYAQIDENGSYVVRVGNEDGLPSGDYKVTVTANEAPKQIRTKDGGPVPSGKLLTPPWYSVKDKSGLTATVKPGKNEINLELKSQPPPGWKPAGAKG